MARVAKLLILIPLAIILGALALANRTPVRLSIDPFSVAEPTLSISVPLFVVAFAALLVGILIGGAAAWLNQGKWRRAARARRQEVAELKAEARRRLPEIGAGSGVSAATPH